MGKKKIEYLPKPGATFGKDRAQKYGEELARLLETSDGQLNPEQIVEAARPESSPLHDYFEWDDSIAAEKWRKQQARQLVDTIIYHVGDGETRRIERIVWNVKSNTGERQYFTPDKIRMRNSYQVSLAQECLDDIKSWFERYHEIIDIVQGRMIVKAFMDGFIALMRTAIKNMK